MPKISVFSIVLRHYPRLFPAFALQPKANTDSRKRLIHRRKQNQDEPPLPVVASGANSFPFSVELRASDAVLRHFTKGGKCS